MIDTFIECSDLTKYYRTPPALNVFLRTPTNPLVNKTVSIKIHGVTYDRTTNANGVASLNINLGPGTYTAEINFAGDTQYNGSSKTVTVTVNPRYFSLDTPSLVKDYGGDEALVVTIKDLYTSTPVVGKEFSITIYGVTYNRTTDENGQGKLNINLMPGVYDYSVLVPSDEGSSAVTGSGTVKVMASTFMDGIDIFKFDDETVVYQCAVYDPFSRLLDVTVTLTVNGVSYTRSSGDDGLVKLNIRLGAGEYTLKAEYAGDNLHHPSSVSNRIVSKARTQYLTTVSNGLSIPGNNRGFMESHIYDIYYDADKSKQGDWRVILPTLKEMTENGADIPFTSYEITETDPRVKTAKFTTSKYMDLTKGRRWVYITSPYHENFGGQVLNVDYDKSTGLYTYQCQDGRRQYLNKGRTTSTDAKAYYIIEALLIRPNMTPGESYTFPISQELKNNPVNQKLLSGLHPINHYDNLKSGALKFSNKMVENMGEILSFDSEIDKIMNLAHYGGFPTDVYFTPDGICHIDPIDLDAWMKTGFVLTHPDLASYKYGFDITNIITGVQVKQNTGNTYYKDALDLMWIVGRQEAMVDPVTTTTTSTGGGSSSSGSSSGSGGVDMGKPHHFVVGCDGGTSTARIREVINALTAKGHTCESVGQGPSVITNYGLTSKSKGKIAIFICNGIDGGNFYDFVQSYYHYDHMILMYESNTATTDKWLTCNGMKNTKLYIDPRQGYGSVVYNSGVQNYTAQQWCQKYSNKLSYVCGPLGCKFQDVLNNLVNGRFNGGDAGTSTSTASTSSGSSSSTTTTAVDEVATYQKSLDKMAESVRGLLSFEIKLPLNHTMFKELHTNQFLWTQLPPEFKLVNLEKIFKILPSYKVNRGVSYVENRWYVEKIVTKMDSSGLFATITLNPFPSSYSVYSNAVKGYLDAYNQAFKQQDTTTTGTSSSGGTGQPRLGRDSTDTNSMRCKSGGYYGNAGTGENFDSCAQKGYAQQDRKYYEWARKYNDPISLAKALAKRFSYEGYSGNKDANAEVTHNNGGTIYCNCYDACRLVKCCFDAAGLDCVVITGTIYGYGHGWNAVKYNGSWYSFDLCFEYTAGTDQKGSNALRKFF